MCLIPPFSFLFKAEPEDSFDADGTDISKKNKLERMNDNG